MEENTYRFNTRLDWKQHVSLQLVIEKYRLRTTFRVLTAGKKIAWRIAMTIAAYGVELMWEEQAWGEAFEELTAGIGHAVAGTFRTAKGADAVRVADIPPPLLL
jgi:hypothetical protein